jgi:MoaA/NifB/PqqE/SkfB family radical SAM enzyme
MSVRAVDRRTKRPRLARLRSAARALTNPALPSLVKVRLNMLTDRTFALPILLYAPTSRCNSRCVSCDWWKTDGATDLKRAEIVALAQELPALGTKLVVFTGGEPLVREDVFEVADLFRAQGVTLHLLTSGLALERHASPIVERFDAVTVSLDGHTKDLYREIRGVDGLPALERGIRKVKALRPGLPVRARSTLHRHNFRALPDLIDKANAMGLDQVSFLAADVTSESFGRQSSLAPMPSGLLLSPEEAAEFERVIDEALRSHDRAFRDGKVAEQGDRLRRLGRYYRAQHGEGPFPEVRCNAPWASAVVEADGTVRPCFFQPAVGNVREKGLEAILDGSMVAFRKGLDVGSDRICQRCVCSLDVGLRSRVW